MQRLSAACDVRGSCDLGWPAGAGLHHGTQACAYGVMASRETMCNVHSWGHTHHAPGSALMVSSAPGPLWNPLTCTGPAVMQATTQQCMLPREARSALMVRVQLMKHSCQQQL